MQVCFHWFNWGMESYFIKAGDKKSLDILKYMT